MAQPAYQLDWNLIRTFTAVTTTGSLSAAATALSLTYPTVARHIATLEETLQLTLFDRTSSGMSPTAAGERLAATAKDMRAQALAFETVTDALRMDPGGTVRITLSDFLIPLAPELLEPLKPNALEPGPNPGRATLEIVPSATLLKLMQHDADIALRHIRPTTPDLICRKVGNVALSLWAKDSYLAEHRTYNGNPKHGTNTELPTLSYIDGVTHSNLQRGAERLGFAVPDECINYRSDCVWSQIQAARRGWGVVVLPNYLGAHYAELEHLETPTPIPPLELWLVARQDMREKPLHRQTFDALAASVAATFTESGDTKEPLNFTTARSGAFLDSKKHQPIATSRARSASH